MTRITSIFLAMMFIVGCLQEKARAGPKASRAKAGALKGKLAELAGREKTTAKK